MEIKTPQLSVGWVVVLKKREIIRAISTCSYVHEMKLGTVV